MSRGEIRLHVAPFTHPDLRNVVFLFVSFFWGGGKPKDFQYLCLDPSLFLFRTKVFPYYWLTDAHGVVKESMSHVASIFANMSIASHQEDKVE